MASRRIKSVELEMGNYLRATKTPQRVVISPAAKSIKSWMDDITKESQVSDSVDNLADARSFLVEASERLQSRDLNGFINSVKSAHEALSSEEQVEKEESPVRRRSIKSLLF